ncbi:MAG: cytochrome c-type biogenesis CcmF C-terminal domain-containing protein, partial [Candidatus Dormibacteraceae bacterium]
EYVRGARFAARLPGAWAPAALRLLARNRRRYGAYLAHIGIVVAAAGIAGSHLWQQKAVAAAVRPGQTVSVAGYRMRYEGFTSARYPDHVAETARLRMGGETLTPTRLLYASLGGQSASRVAIRSTPLADLYIVLVGTAPDGTATFQLFVNPLVTWIWSGAGLLILGVLLGNASAPFAAPSSRRARRSSPVPSRITDEYSGAVR